MTRTRRKPTLKPPTDAEERAIQAARESSFIPVGDTLTVRDIQALDSGLLARLMAGLMAMGTCRVEARDIHNNLDADAKELVRDLLPHALLFLMQWEEAL